MTTETTTTQTIEALRGELRRTKRLMAVAVGGVAAALLMGAASPPGDARFGTITAERINIAEPDGLYRVILTNAARSPGPMAEAREGAREGHRNFPFAGLLIFDEKGMEQGGYGTGTSPNMGSLVIHTLDWNDGQSEGEATVNFRQISADGVGNTGTWIWERPKAGEDPTKGIDRRRIKMHVPGRDAELLLADTQGRDRIVLRVDEAGEAKIEIRDAEGKVVFSAPNAQ